LRHVAPRDRDANRFAENFAKPASRRAAIAVKAKIHENIFVAKLLDSDSARRCFGVPRQSARIYRGYQTHS
jgi:hypothetical protein